MLTPIDIENKDFKKSMFGYDKSDVEEFLAAVLEDYEKLYKENISFKDRINVLSDAIKQYKTMEDTVQNALIVAQAAAEDVKRNASERAENILKHAELKASEMLALASGEVTKVSMQYNEIKRNLEIYKAKVNSLISAQVSLLNEILPDNEVNNENKN